MSLTLGGSLISVVSQAAVELNGKQKGTTKTQGLFASLVAAVVMLKRKAKNLIFKRRARKSRNGVKSAFHAEIQKSQIQVRNASFGRPVITMGYNDIDDYREYMDRRKATWREAKNASGSTRRMATRPSTFGVPTDIARKEYLHRNQGIPIAQRIKALSATNVGGGVTQVFEGDAAKSNSFFEAVLEKNAHLTMKEGNGDRLKKTSEVKTNVKGIQRMDVQDALQYHTGTAVYFGATIALQSRHGGFLSFNHSEIKASAYKLLPSTRFIVWNCDQLKDFGVVRYGDAVWLQAGQHEILGAHYGGGPAVHDTTRVIQPALVNCRKANFVKAQQYGRWIVLNYKNPGGSVGEQVLHEDSILLEQEWCYLASKTPSDSHMEKKMSFEEVAAGGLVDVFKPSTEAVWKIHIVTLPSDDNIDNRVRQYLLAEAQQQMNTSAKERRVKETFIHIPLRKKISPELTEEYVCSNQLLHKGNNVLSQRSLLKKFDRQMRRDFTDPLQYGAASRPADALSDLSSDSDGENHRSSSLRRPRTAPARKRHTNTTTTASNGAFGMSSGGRGSAVATMEERYWTVAEQVLTNTRSLEAMPTVMNRYYKLDIKKKEVAARIIQKFFKEHVKVVSWRRVFVDVDFNRARQFEKYGVDNVTRTGVLQFSSDGKQRHIVNKMIGYGFMSNVIRYLTPTLNKELLMGDTASFLENVDKPNRPKTAPATRDSTAAAVAAIAAIAIPAEDKPESQQATNGGMQLPAITHKGDEAEKIRKKSLCFPEQHVEAGVTRVIASAETKGHHHSHNHHAQEDRYSNTELMAVPRGHGEKSTEEIIKEEHQRETEPEQERARRHSASHSLIPADPLRLKLENQADQQYSSSKTKSKKKRFDDTMRSLRKSEQCPDGLPEDVCEYNKDLNLSYSVKFLSVASSKGSIFKDLKAVKRSSKKRK